MAYFTHAVHSQSPFPANNAFSIGKKTPSRRYAMRPIVNMPDKDQGTDTRNMHKKFVKDRACGSEDILAGRQTHRQTYSSQYFATAAAGEI